MFRPVTSASSPDALSRAGLFALRPAEGHGERASSDAVEQQNIAVQQVPIVALGGGVQGPLTSEPAAPDSTAQAPAQSAAQSRPSSPPSSASAESLTEAAIRAELAAAEVDAAATGTSVALETAGEARTPSEIAEQIAAKSFITHATRPVQGDPEATLQKLLRMRDDALDPPASVADLAIATAAAIRIGRLVRDRYAEQVAATGGAPETTRQTLPPTSVKA